jgi:hypothetical protein
LESNFSTYLGFFSHFFSSSIWVVSCEVIREIVGANFNHTLFGNTPCQKAIFWIILWQKIISYFFVTILMFYFPTTSKSLHNFTWIQNELSSNTLFGIWIQLNLIQQLN